MSTPTKSPCGVINQSALDKIKERQAARAKVANLGLLMETADKPNCEKINISFPPTSSSSRNESSFSSSSNRSPNSCKSPSYVIKNGNNLKVVITSAVEKLNGIKKIDNSPKIAENEKIQLTKPNATNNSKNESSIISLSSDEEEDHSSVPSKVGQVEENLHTTKAESSVDKEQNESTSSSEEPCSDVVSSSDVLENNSHDQSVNPKKRKSSADSARSDDNKKDIKRPCRIKNSVTDDDSDSNSTTRSLNVLKSEIIKLGVSRQNMNSKIVNDQRKEVEESQAKNALLMTKVTQLVKVIVQMKKQIDILQGRKDPSRLVENVAIQCCSEELDLIQNFRSPQRPTAPPQVGRNISGNRPVAAKSTASIRASHPQPSGNRPVAAQSTASIGASHPQPTRLVMVPANFTNTSPTSKNSVSNVNQGRPNNVVGGQSYILQGSGGNVSRLVSQQAPPPLTRAPNGSPQIRMGTPRFSATTNYVHNLPPLPPPAPSSGNNLRHGHLLPPQPILTAEKTNENGSVGVQLTWNHAVGSNYAKMKHYQLYAYQDNPNATWKPVGTIIPLDLPMACTLTSLQQNEKYYFTIRCVDIHGQTGPFSAHCLVKI